MLASKLLQSLLTHTFYTKSIQSPGPSLFPDFSSTIVAPRLLEFIGFPLPRHLLSLYIIAKSPPQIPATQIIIAFFFQDSHGHGLSASFSLWYEVLQIPPIYLFLFLCLSLSSFPLPSPLLSLLSFSSFPCPSPTPSLPPSLTLCPPSLLATKQPCNQP